MMLRKSNEEPDMTAAIRRAIWLLVLAAMLLRPGAIARAQGDPRDWPMYNHDLSGSRHNPAETVIGRSNAGHLVEKWRFPARGSSEKIGVIHATPTVVDGHVYFGTATDPTFYKVGPDGKLCWAYHKPTRSGQSARVVSAGAQGPAHDFRFQSGNEGIMTSALVPDDTV
jgi:polyvinyl alcohol dehydrogenase (cytochrome)